MTNEEIISMAREAGFDEHHAKFDTRFERFAKLVVEKEREAIWNILFDYAGRDDLSLDDESLLKHLADLIRARGEQ